MNQTISFAQAWAHCFGTTSYVIWLIVGVIVAAFLGWYAFAKAEGGWKAILFAGALFVLGFALLMRPAEIAANTTPDQAARGIYIGY